MGGDGVVCGMRNGSDACDNRVTRAPEGKISLRFGALICVFILF